MPYSPTELSKKKIRAIIEYHTFIDDDGFCVTIEGTSTAAQEIHKSFIQVTAQRDALRAMCQEFIEFQFSHHLGLHGLKAATDHYVALKRKARQVIEENS